MPFSWIPFLNPADLVPKLLNSNNPVLVFLIQLILVLFISPLKIVSGLSRVLFQSFDGLERETAYNVQTMLEVAAHDRHQDLPTQSSSNPTHTLPDPILRYLSGASNHQQKPVKFAFMKQTGKFRFLNNSSDLPQQPSPSSSNARQWHTITADEYVVTGGCAPGLCIRARINLSTFSNLTGYVSLIQGRATSHWRSWSLFNSSSSSSSSRKIEEKADVDPKAALARWLVGAACCGCAALQPSPWLSWEPIHTTDDAHENIVDQFRARIIVTGDDGVRVAAIVEVNSQGELVKIKTEESITRKHNSRMAGVTDDDDDGAHQVAYLSKYVQNTSAGGMAPSEVEVAWEIGGKSQSYAVLHIDELRCWDRF